MLYYLLRKKRTDPIKLSFQLRGLGLQLGQRQRKESFNTGAQDAVSHHEGRVDLLIRTGRMGGVFHPPVRAQDWAEISRTGFSSSAGTNRYHNIRRERQCIP